MKTKKIIKFSIGIGKEESEIVIKVDSYAFMFISKMNITFLIMKLSVTTIIFREKEIVVTVADTDKDLIEQVANEFLDTILDDYNTALKSRN